VIATGLLLLAVALLGVPLFAVIVAGALLAFHNQEIDLSVIGIEIYRLAESPVLIAIPLFTLAGYVLTESAAPARLVRFTRAWLGWLPGGLAIVALVTCALFTALTGASGVTIIALGALIYPGLRSSGYGERFSLGLVTSAGSLGVLFVPALPLILYGVVAQQAGVGPPIRIDDLFVAGVLPGILMIVVLGVYAIVSQRKRVSPTPFSWAEARAALGDSWLELPLPFVVLAGIYGGALAISEVAATTAIYVIVVEVLIRREVGFRRLPGVMREASVMVGAILVILGVSQASTNAMIDAEVPTRIFDFIRAHVDSRLSFLLLLNVFLLVLGMMLDIFSAIVLIVPIILPVAAAYGVNPVHLGIVFLANMQLGYVTPPVGMNLFIASYRFNRPVMEVFRATLPFFFLLLACVALITYWPALSLVLVDR
jgi:tripartite ATP-independent transporter DctM subunit